MQPSAQTFRAATPKDALDAVKSSLGTEAVILSTREVPLLRGGQRQFEVVARRGQPRAPVPFAAPPEPARPPRRELARLADRLIDLGVDDRVVDALLARARTGRERDPAADDPSLLRAAILDLLGAPAPAPWRPAEPNGALALVGPTGAGKTTTLAKIAARAVLEEGLRVALINLDTFRIGAIDQLGRYAEILGLPMYVARDRHELSRALSHAANADLVLIDTAGRSPLDEEGTRRQAALLAEVPGVRMLLTLAAGTSRAVLERIAARYHALRPDGLVVTKLDEAISLPASLTVTWSAPWPVACVCAGQRVPEDIGPLDRERLLEEVFA